MKAPAYAAASGISRSRPAPPAGDDSAVASIFFSGDHGSSRCGPTGGEARPRHGVLLAPVRGELRRRHPATDRPPFGRRSSRLCASASGWARHSLAASPSRRPGPGRRGRATNPETALSGQPRPLAILGRMEEPSRPKSCGVRWHRIADLPPEAESRGVGDYREGVGKCPEARREIDYPKVDHIAIDNSPPAQRGVLIGT